MKCRTVCSRRRTKRFLSYRIITNYSGVGVVVGGMVVVVVLLVVLVVLVVLVLVDLVTKNTIILHYNVRY